MKLYYGFSCDYCGAEIDYTDKTSIKFEKYYKNSNYDKVKSYGSASIIALDLCNHCAGILYRRLETDIITPRKKNLYQNLCKLHQKRKQIAEKNITTR